MTLPITLPDWLPPWVPVVVLIPALLYALAFLFMPFSVIGVKSRLEGVETRLDEIQGEIRSLALRLPEPLRGGFDDTSLAYVQPDPVARRATPALARPPIPPAPHEAEETDPGPQRLRREPLQLREPGTPAPRSPRTEPRFDRPR